MNMQNNVTLMLEIALTADVLMFKLSGMDGILADFDCSFEDQELHYMTL